MRKYIYIYIYIYILKSSFCVLLDLSTDFYDALQFACISIYTHCLLVDMFVLRDIVYVCLYVRNCDVFALYIYSMFFVCLMFCVSLLLAYYVSLWLTQSFRFKKMQKSNNQTTECIIIRIFPFWENLELCEFWNSCQEYVERERCRSKPWKTIPLNFKICSTWRSTKNRKHQIISQTWNSSSNSKLLKLDTPFYF